MIECSYDNIYIRNGTYSQKNTSKISTVTNDIIEVRYWERFHKDT